MLVAMYDQVGHHEREGNVDIFTGLFDTKNHSVRFELETSDGKNITHFWVKRGKQHLDVLSVFAGSGRIRAEKSNVSGFSATINDTQPAILRWNAERSRYTTENILEFFHEVGHAMSGVQIDSNTFAINMGQKFLQTESDRTAYWEHEMTAQKNAMKLVQVLIRKGILEHSPELTNLLEQWLLDYETRVKAYIESSRKHT